MTDKKGEKVKIPTLLETLKFQKKDLISYLEKVCTVGSELFWFKKSPIEKTVTLVCHIDTVHEKTYTTRIWSTELQKMVDVEPEIRNPKIFFDHKEQVFWSPDGLGADDRAGVFGILRVYAAMPDELKPNLLFCDEEESGGRGARQAAIGLPELSSSLFMIELDRRRSKDCVFYNDEPKDFVAYIEKFGFKKEYGSFSDVSHLGKEFKLCTTNLSVGFYDEHSKQERLECKKLAKTINKTCAMVEDAVKQGRRWENPNAKSYSYLDRDYGFGSFSGVNRNWRQDSFWGKDKKKEEKEGKKEETLVKPNGHGKKISDYTKEELSKYPYLQEYLAAKKMFV